jgi:hypothetical protein
MYVYMSVLICMCICVVTSIRQIIDRTTKSNNGQLQKSYSWYSWLICLIFVDCPLAGNLQNGLVTEVCSTFLIHQKE